MKSGGRRNRFRAVAWGMALVLLAAVSAVRGRLDAAARWSFDHAYPAVDDALIARMAFGDLCVGPSGHGNALCTVHSGLEATTWICSIVAALCAGVWLVDRIRRPRSEANGE